jgi:hypothetical protein
MKKNPLESALPHISTFFDHTSKKVFRQFELSNIFSSQKTTWQLPERIGVTAFITFLLDKNMINKVYISFGNSRTEARYLWGNVSEYELALSVNPQAYLTHNTALYWHKLTEKPPDTVYVNYEQSKHIKSSGDLTQEAIDRAFQNPARVSNSTINYKDKTIRILNGMYTGQYGVIEKTMREGEYLRITNLPRTLVDIAVRPVYSGGVSNILSAYRLTQGKFQANELIEVLNHMQYLYPFHQAIGFYLDMADVYDASDLQVFLDIEMKFDFYLTNQIKETAYSDKWRIYYPNELSSSTKFASAL